MLVIKARYHYQLMMTPYQGELRESAFLITDALNKGINPYALNMQPIYTYVYGITYSFIVHISGINNFIHSVPIQHKLISGFFIFTSCLIFFLMLRHQKIKKLYSFVGTAMFYPALVFSFTALGRPCSLGETLFLLSVFIPYFLEFSLAGCLISILIGIAAFYTKPYFILGSFYIIFYILFFKSIKKALYLASIFLFLFVISMLAINNYFPTYFYDVLFVNQQLADNVWVNFISQFEIFFKDYNPGLSILGILILSPLIYKYRDVNINKYLLSSFLKKINYCKLDKALIDVNMQFYLFCFLASSIVLIILGQNESTWMTYYFHLLQAFFIIVIFKYLPKNTYAILVIVPLLMANVYKTNRFGGQGYLSESDRAQWGKMETLVKNHSRILGSAALEALLIENGKKVYEGGHTVCSYQVAHLSNWPSFFKVNEIYQINRKYHDDIQDSIRKKEFEIIAVPSDWWLIGESFIKLYYSPVDKVVLRMPHVQQRWEINIWIPKKEIGEHSRMMFRK